MTSNSPAPMTPSFPSLSPTTPSVRLMSPSRLATRLLMLMAKTPTPKYGQGKASSSLKVVTEMFPSGMVSSQVGFFQKSKGITIMSSLMSATVMRG